LIFLSRYNLPRSLSDFEMFLMDKFTSLTGYLATLEYSI